MKLDFHEIKLRHRYKRHSKLKQLVVLLIFVFVEVLRDLIESYLEVTIEAIVCLVKVRISKYSP